MPTINLGPCDCCGGSVDCTGSCEDAVAYNSGPNFVDIVIGLVPQSIQTITVPDAYSLPVLVCYSGACDDGLAINGTRISKFAEQPRPFCINSRTFQAGTWNDSGPWQCKGKFCFKEGCTTNPLP